MSGSKSVNKAARSQEVKRLRNRVIRGRTRTVLRQARQSVDAGDAGVVKSTSAAATSSLDRAVTKGLFHKNKAARLKSRLDRRVNASLSGN
ncbi:MAG: 30S ribosomal protein S20 [Dehalococcoidia bacterium]|nr:30S ribosomal protein S20 [Dehalococcoidia bacterium]